MSSSGILMQCLPAFPKPWRGRRERRCQKASKNRHRNVVTSSSASVVDRRSPNTSLVSRSLIAVSALEAVHAAAVPSPSGRLYSHGRSWTRDVSANSVRQGRDRSLTIGAKRVVLVRGLGCRFVLSKRSTLHLREDVRRVRVHGRL